MQPIRKILIANRGEIVVRIARTARDMGIKTVAVYSDADRNAIHSSVTDEAIYIGSSPSSESYLCGDKIIDAALSVNADAIHPGYGFLSEDSGFAMKIVEAGLIFIGPPAESMSLMGDKLAAKKLAEELKVPMVPGSGQALEDPVEGKKIADKIGYPILIKAAAGGGGKGMRLVESEEKFHEYFKMACSEAKSSFGKAAVFIEKYIGSAKHIEIQLMADQSGQVLHFFERECSVQRRHQKVIEESPSSSMTPSLRKEMTEAAVALAKACHYESAGTIEFLVDEDQKFYFLEMNTRLQVEHPVTEMVTGLDLVRMQIEVAEGKKFSVSQEDIKLSGHAIQLRVYAEDPLDNFSPDIGRISRYVKPSGEFVRLDDGIQEGQEISIYYDPMLGKLIAWGSNRLEAIRHLKNAIALFIIDGIKTTLPFGYFVLEHPEFIHGTYDTRFVNTYYSAEVVEAHLSERALLASLIAAKLREVELSKSASIQTSNDWWKNRK